MTVTNVGNVAVEIGDSTQSNHQSRLVLCGLTNAAAQSSHAVAGATGRKFDWAAEPNTVVVADELFTSVFRKWFPQRPIAILEAKETEEYSADFLLSSTLLAAHLEIQLYEGIIRIPEMDRPYFWLVEKYIPLE